MRAEKHDQPTRPKARRLTKKTLAAGGVVTTLAVVGSFTGIGAATAADSDQSESLAQVISSDLLNDVIGGLTGEQLLDVGVVTSGNPSDEGENFNPLDVEALGLLDVSLPTINLPLLSTPEQPNGLLDLGNAGLINSFGHSPSPTESKAASGVVTADGAINVDAINEGSTDFASVDLIDLLRQLNLDGVSDAVIDELSLNLGALASVAEKNAGTTSSEYVVAGAELNLSSPLAGDLTTALGGISSGLGTALNEALGSDGVLVGALNDIDLDVNLGLLQTTVESGSVGVNGLPEALDEIDGLLTSTIADDNGLLSIDLGAGTIAIDLSKLVAGGSLNDLEANTLLIDSDTATQITDAAANLLGNIVSSVVDPVKNIVNSLQVDLELELELRVPLVATVGADVTINAPLGQLLGTAEDFDTDLIDIQVEQGGLVGALLSALGVTLDGLVSTLLQPVLNGVLNAVGSTLGTAVVPLLDGLEETISTPLSALLDGLSPVFSGLNEVVNITINEQPAPGHLGDESFTVNAIGIALLPSLNVANVSLASSTVRALDEAPFTPEIAVDPDSVEQGGTTTVTGEGFEPEETVTITVGGVEVGTVVADADGEFSFDYEVPADATPGDVTVSAEGETSQTPATDDLTITEAAPVYDTSIVVNPDRVEQGGTTTVTGEGFEPEE
ncbi:MAG: choice-of-anchor G family protein, partial [Microbacterium gubbeenense]|uniref:choice-of-anchor G family protein n=1 Tax=Microbacterium gubbeenense TaxID=159896 RepID=UPI003F943159